MPVRHRRTAVAVLVAASLAVGVALPAAAGPASTAPAPVKAPTVEAIARQLLANGDTAVSVSVWKGGKPLLVQVWGKAANAAASPQSRFQVASVSKLVTSLALHRLAAKGKLDLDAKVAPMLKAFGIKPHSSWSKVTVRQLLAHTSGAPSGDSQIFGQGAAQDCVGVARSLATASLWRAPGTRFTYSNGGYCILGLVLQFVTGTSVEKAGTRLVWAPAGVQGPHMARTGQSSKGDVKHPVTPGRRYFEPLGAAGAWVASPSELVAVLASVTPAEKAALTAPTKASLGSYGEGARVMPDGAWGHTGTLEAARSCVFVEPDGTIWAATVAGKSPVNGAALHTKLLPAIKALAGR